MADKEILGYRELPKLVDEAYNYSIRSYVFSPIYKTGPGYIVTQAFILCRECNATISSTGGPGYGSVCLKCYPSLKLFDFSQGHEHVIQDRK